MDTLQTMLNMNYQSNMGEPWMIQPRLATQRGKNLTTASVEVRKGYSRATALLFILKAALLDEYEVKSNADFDSLAKRTTANISIGFANPFFCFFFLPRTHRQVCSCIQGAHKTRNFKIRNEPLKTSNFLRDRPGAEIRHTKIVVRIEKYCCGN